MNRPLHVGAAALAAAALLTACSSGGSSPVATPTTAAASAAASPSASPADPAKNGAADAGIDPTNPPAVVATATGIVPTPGDPKATTRVDVFGLQRHGKLLVLTAAVTQTTSAPAFPQTSIFSALGAKFWSPELIDPVNLKLYKVVRSSGGDELQTGPNSANAAIGQPLYVYAAFASPAPGVTALDLDFGGGIPVIRDIPVS